jgi:hypothetical protein
MVEVGKLPPLILCPLDRIITQEREGKKDGIQLLF